MLNEKQLEAIDYLIVNDKTKEDIAKLCGTSTRNLYRWMKNEEFKAEWQKRADAYQSSLKKEVQNCMLNKVTMAMQNIWNLANKSDSDKIKLDANIFIYESQMGKAPSKIEQTNIDGNKETEVKNMDDILAEIEEDNIIIKRPKKQGA